MSTWDVEQQLGLIGEMAVLFGDAVIDFWLSGGWAVDFHLGRVSRPHSDVDLIFGLSVRDQVWELLRRGGFADGAAQASKGVEWFEHTGVLVEVTYITQTAGSIVTPGFEQWPWPDGSFSGTPVTFADVTVRAVSVLGLLDMKVGYQRHLGEPPRPQDIGDIEVLKGLLGS